MNGDQVPLDETLELLADRTRRRLVTRLRGADELSVAQLADELAGHGETRTDGGTSEGGRRIVEVRLRHVHLPRLADAGVIDYDPEVGSVEPTDGTESICEVLDAVSGTIGPRN